VNSDATVLVFCILAPMVTMWIIRVVDPYFERWLIRRALHQLLAAQEEQRRYNREFALIVKEMEET
jgi:hypothetical protein